MCVVVVVVVMRKIRECEDDGCLAKRGRGKSSARDKVKRSQ